MRAFSLRLCICTPFIFLATSIISFNNEKSQKQQHNCCTTQYCTLPTQYLNNLSRIQETELTPALCDTARSIHFVIFSIWNSWKFYYNCHSLNLLVFLQSSIMPPAPKQAAYGLEIWVQPGIPEDGELVFNVHFRNAEGTEWEVNKVLLLYN